MYFTIERVDSRDSLRSTSSLVNGKKWLLLRKLTKKSRKEKCNETEEDSNARRKCRYISNELELVCNKANDKRRGRRREKKAETIQSIRISSFFGFSSFDKQSIALKRLVFHFRSFSSFYDFIFWQYQKILRTINEMDEVFHFYSVLFLIKNQSESSYLYLIFVSSSYIIGFFRLFDVSLQMKIIIIYCSFPRIVFRIDKKKKKKWSFILTTRHFYGFIWDNNKICIFSCPCWFCSVFLSLTLLFYFVSILCFQSKRCASKKIYLLNYYYHSRAYTIMVLECLNWNNNDKITKNMVHLPFNKTR